MPRLNECLEQREQLVGRGLPRQCAWTRTSLTYMRCHPRFVATRNALQSRNVSGLGCSEGFGSVSSDEQPHARLLGAAGAAMRRLDKPRGAISASWTQKWSCRSIDSSNLQKPTASLLCFLWILMHHRKPATKSSPKADATCRSPRLNRSGKMRHRRERWYGALERVQGMRSSELGPIGHPLSAVRAKVGLQALETSAHELEAPTPLQCPITLSGGIVPVACLLDALQEQGFVEVRVVVCMCQTAFRQSAYVESPMDALEGADPWGYARPAVWAGFANLAARRVEDQTWDIGCSCTCCPMTSSRTPAIERDVQGSAQQFAYGIADLPACVESALDVGELQLEVVQQEIFDMRATRSIWPGDGWRDPSRAIWHARVNRGRSLQFGGVLREWNAWLAMEQPIWNSIYGLRSSFSAVFFSACWLRRADVQNYARTLTLWMGDAFANMSMARKKENICHPFEFAIWWFVTIFTFARDTLCHFFRNNKCFPMFGSSWFIIPWRCENAYSHAATLLTPTIRTNAKPTLNNVATTIGRALRRKDTDTPNIIQMIVASVAKVSLIV